MQFPNSMSLAAVYECDQTASRFSAPKQRMISLPSPKSGTTKKPTSTAMPPCDSRSLWFVQTFYFVS